MRINRNVKVAATAGYPILVCSYCKEEIQITTPIPPLSRFLKLALFWNQLHAHPMGGKR